jgi:hypothetical protein
MSMAVSTHEFQHPLMAIKAETCSEDMSLVTELLKKFYDKVLRQR